MRLVITIVFCTVVWSAVYCPVCAQQVAGTGATDFGEGLPGIHSPVLNELAHRPGRPPWAPLDMLWGHREVVPYLLKVLNSDEPSNRARAAFVLGQIGNPQTADALWAARHDNDRTVRLHAGIALAYLGDEQGLPAARAALISAPRWLRYYAIMGLWRIGTPHAWALLNHSQAAQPPFLAQVIAAALATPATVPPLERSATGAEQLAGPLTNSFIWESVADVFITEADWWWHRGDYDQAIRCLQVVVFMQPDRVETYGDIAWLQWSMGHNTEAIGTYHQAIDTNPTNPRAYFNLGFHYSNIGQYEPAVRYLEQAVSNGGSQLMRRMYAHTLEAAGQIEGAQAGRAATLAPQSSGTASRRGGIFWGHRLRGFGLGFSGLLLGYSRMGRFLRRSFWGRPRKLLHCDGHADRSYSHGPDTGGKIYVNGESLLAAHLGNINAFSPQVLYGLNLVGVASNGYCVGTGLYRADLIAGCGVAQVRLDQYTTHRYLSDGHSDLDAGRFYAQATNSYIAFVTGFYLNLNFSRSTVSRYIHYGDYFVHRAHQATGAGDGYLIGADIRGAGAVALSRKPATFNPNRSLVTDQLVKSDADEEGIKGSIHNMRQTARLHGHALFAYLCSTQVSDYPDSGQHILANCLFAFQDDVNMLGLDAEHCQSLRDIDAGNRSQYLFVPLGVFTHVSPQRNS